MSGSAQVVMLPASEQLALLSRREISAVELLELHLARIAERNGELNAIVLPRLDAARADAVAADRARARAAERIGALHGLPFTVKDPIAVAGMPWPNGSRLSADAVAGYDAPVVRRMRDAGAILVGKTNVPEFSSFYDTTNELFGPTRNPHSPDRSAGGSSGGEAVAVATGMSPLGIGSDLGSSIRNPAHFTGVFGLKPSRSLVPARGHAPDAGAPAFERFAAIGPLARSAADLELALRVIADTPPAPPRAGAGVVGVYEDDLFQPVAADCRRAVRMAAEALSAAGYATAEDRPPSQDAIRRCYDAILGAEMRPTLAALTAGRVHELSRYGRMLLDGVSDVGGTLVEHLAVWRELASLERGVDEWFDRRRLALCPVAPGPAPAIGQGFTEIDGEPVAPGPKLSLCTLANAAGLPSASVPVLRTAAGLPVGVQLTGGRGRDLEVVRAAEALERAFGGFVVP